MTKTEILEQWYEQVWVQGNLEAIDDYFVPETEAAGLIPGMRVGPDDFRHLVTAFRMHVGEIDLDIVNAVESHDWLAALLHVRTSRADNGKPIEVTGQVMVRFSGNRIVEAYNQFDFVALFEQLGQMPEDTLPICMTGHKLVWA